jgi:hypothetical protein
MEHWMDAIYINPSIQHSCDLNQIHFLTTHFFKV